MNHKSPLVILELSSQRIHILLGIPAERLLYAQCPWDPESIYNY